MRHRSDRKIDAMIQLLETGRNVCFCCSPDSPAPPDYGPIAAANEVSAKYAKEVADNDLAFRKQQYDDSKPKTDEAWAIAKEVSAGQLADAATSRDRATSSWNRWQDVGIAQQDKMIADANNYGTEADQAAQAGRAVADVRAQGSNVRAQGERAMASMGVNPNSGRFAAMNRGAELSEAATAAGASTNARSMSRDKGIALRAGASAALAGQPNVAGQQAGISSTAGNSAVGNSNIGANSGVQWANYASGGVGNALAASSQSIQANLGLGQLMNTGYGIQSQADAASSAGMGSMIGGLGMAAATMF